MKKPSSNKPVRIHRTLGTNLLFIALAAGLTLSMTGLLHWRANAAVNTVEKAPLPVSVMSYESQDTYQRQVTYLGVAEAGRKADLGFEAAGKLANVQAREGKVVARGDVLAELDDSRMQAQRRGMAADLERVKTELQLAELKASRQENLIATGAVSAEAHDETRLRAQALRSQVQAVTAALDDLDVALEKMQLRAPYDGTVAARYLDDGAVVNAGTPVMRLVETARLEAHVGIPARRANELREGEHYTLQLRGESAPATLLSLRPDIDPVTRTRTAVFALPAELNALDGESLTLSLEQEVAMRGGWVPLEALKEGQRGTWTVLRLEPDERGTLAVREAVEVLDTRGDMAYVRGTLPEGAQVIREGIHRVTPGVVVTRLED